eukprot:3423525-Prymnesium_polylepis.1
MGAPAQRSTSSRRQTARRSRAQYAHGLAAHGPYAHGLAGKLGGCSCRKCLVPLLNRDGCRSTQQPRQTRPCLLPTAFFPPRRWRTC